MIHAHKDSAPCAELIRRQLHPSWSSSPSTAVLRFCDQSFTRRSHYPIVFSLPGSHLYIICTNIIVTLGTCSGRSASGLSGRSPDIFVTPLDLGERSFSPSSAKFPRARCWEARIPPCSASNSLLACSTSFLRAYPALYAQLWTRFEFVIVHRLCIVSTPASPLA